MHSNTITKERLTEIIDGLHLQIIWVLLCIDSLEAMKAIDRDSFKIAQNFFYITHSSLIYRYTMELSKLSDDTEECSFKRICNMCSKNPLYFDKSFDVFQYCRSAKKEIEKYKDTIVNLVKRRNITLAHNDIDYYLFDKNVVLQNPLDMLEIKAISNVIYTFAKTIQEKIGSTRKDKGYPANSDDVKHLFSLKTDAELLLESEW